MNKEHKDEFDRLTVFISEDNPFFKRLVHLYTIAIQHEKPNDIIDWYDYTGLENIILSYPNSTSCSAFVVAEFMEYLEREYRLKNILTVRFFEEGYLAVQGSF